MSHPSSPSPQGSGFKSEILTYSIAALMAAVVLFFVVAFTLGAFDAMRPKTAAVDAPPAPPPAEPAATAAAAPAPAAATPPPAAPTAPAAGGGDLMAVGQTVYSTVCIACHQPTGLGLPNMFPPLAGSDWVGVKKPDRLIRMVLHGFTGPFTLNGKPFNSPAPLMPPQGATLSDDQIAGVLTFVRSNFGNKAGPVTAAEVKAIREAEKAHAAMWTEAELQKIPVE